MEQKIDVLVVEDNPDDISRIERAFEGMNAECTSTDSSEKALKMLLDGGYQLALIDVELKNGESGFTVVRKAHDAGVKTMMMIFTNTHCTEQSTTAGLNLGADDYILKSVSNDTLNAILEARLRRLRGGTEAKRLVWKDIIFDTDKLKVYKGSVDPAHFIDVQENELRLLKCFMSQPGKTFSVRYLARETLNYSEIPDNINNLMHLRIKKLRRKLGMTEKGKGICGQNGGGYALV